MAQELSCLGTAQARLTATKFGWSSLLNTTTGDGLGRIQIQSWIFTVDNSNMLRCKLTSMEIIFHSMGRFGQSRIQLQFFGVSDDTGGVGVTLSLVRGITFMV